MWSLLILPVSAWVLSEYSGFLTQSKDMQVRLTGNSKLPIGLNVSVIDCLSMYVGPLMNWRLVQGVPHCSPIVSWDQLQSPHNPVNRISGYGKWMDGWDCCFVMDS